MMGVLFLVKDWDIDWYLDGDDTASFCSEDALSAASFTSSVLD